MAVFIHTVRARKRGKPVEVSVRLEIDQISLAQMLGGKAVNAKGRKSVLAGGLIRAFLVSEPKEV